MVGAHGQKKVSTLLYFPPFGDHSPATAVGVGGTPGRRVGEFPSGFWGHVVVRNLGVGWKSELGRHLARERGRFNGCGEQGSPMSFCRRLAGVSYHWEGPRSGYVGERKVLACPGDMAGKTERQKRKQPTRCIGPPAPPSHKERGRGPRAELAAGQNRAFAR